MPNIQAMPTLPVYSTHVLVQHVHLFTGHCTAHASKPLWPGIYIHKEGSHSYKAEHQTVVLNTWHALVHTGKHS